MLASIDAISFLAASTCCVAIALLCTFVFLASSSILISLFMATSRSLAVLCWPSPPPSANSAWSLDDFCASAAAADVSRSDLPASSVIAFCSSLSFIVMSFSTAASSSAVADWAPEPDDTRSSSSLTSSSSLVFFTRASSRSLLASLSALFASSRLIRSFLICLSAVFTSSCRSSLSAVTLDSWSCVRCTISSTFLSASFVVEISRSRIVYSMARRSRSAF